MNLTLLFRIVRFVSLAVVLVTVGTPAPASVVTIGDVDPGGAAAQPDPWVLGADLKVGDSGTGALSVEAGGAVSSVNGYLGWGPASSGEATVSGPGSQWSNSEKLRVGYFGNGTLNVEAGGEVSNVGWGYVGFQPGSTGEALVTGSGSHWNNMNLSGLIVGYQSDGSLNVVAGGLVSNHYGFVGQIAGSTGEVTVAGPGSRWNNSSYLHVGSLSSGTMNVEAGAVVSNTLGYIGHNSGSTGAVTVTGINSQWNNSNTVYIGHKGDGTLNVDTGALVSSKWGYISRHAGSTGTATVTGVGSQWNNSTDLDVGNSGNGTLQVEAGGAVSSRNTFIGRLGGSLGQATVTGPGSEWNNSSLTVGGNTSGAGGAGTLNLNDSGLATVSDTTKLWSTGTINLDGGNLTTGSFDNSDGGALNFHDGTLTVNAAGGSFDPGTGDFTVDGQIATDLPTLVISGTATATLPDKLIVGLSNQARLTVGAGGVVSNNNTGYIGSGGSSTAVATVSGPGSQWNNSSNLIVGYAGDGTLNVTDGGAISNNSYSAIGYHFGSSGEATVSGSDSHWNNLGSLYVGRSGDGKLDVEAGGEVNNTYAFLGRYINSTGEATVTGPGSEWNNSSLTVGGNTSAAGGAGTLNLDNSGLVSVSNTTKLWSTGTINLDGGSLSTGSFDNSELGTLNFSDGTLTVNAAGGVFNPGTSDFTIDGLSSDDLPELVITNTADATLSGDLTVGSSRRGKFTIEAGGVVANTYGIIGDQSYSTGEATVTGPGSHWNNSNDLTVGYKGFGTLNVEAGGVVSNEEGYLGYYANVASGGFDSSRGVATVTGTGSMWNNSGSLVVGGTGSATLDVLDGGVVSNTGGIIGNILGSNGVVTVSGTDSQWNNTGDLTVGDMGNGALNIEGAGVVSNTRGYLGKWAGSNGEATISGIGSQWNNSSDLVVGGTDGHGTLNVLDGGVVSNEKGYLGYYFGGTGTATISGADSQWNNSDALWIGNNMPAAGGAGTLNLDNSGLVSVSGTTRLWSTGTINLDGGSLTTGSFDNSELGVLNFHDGTLTVNAAGGSFDPGAGDFAINGLAADDLPELVITGTASATFSNKLTVGENKPGKLTVAAGGTVSNAGRGYIATSSSSTGEVTVTGPGSHWNNGASLKVGAWGDSVLNVEAGGVVSNAMGFIARYWMSTSMATVTGTNSQWNNSDRLYVGHSGDGTLHVTDEGVVSSDSGWIAHESGSTGSATVTGAGSQWNNLGVMYVGSSGDGSLNVAAGGVVTNTSAYLGSSPASTGEVTVTGSDSRWNNSSFLYVGRYGAGTLNVAAGGVVTNTNGYIGYHSDSTGEATVTGAGSQWNNSGNLYVGKTGTGTLNITDDGLVTVGGTTSIAATGTVNLTGGRFEFGQTTFAEFSTMNAASGAMAGNVVITGVHDVDSLTALQNTAVDLSEVAAANEGLLHGTAILKTSLNNRSTGELRTTVSDWVRFEGLGNTNAGEINNFGGQVDFSRDMTNQSGGFVGGEGQFIADAGWTNQGVMAFSGKTHILGDVVNDTGGQIVTAGGATTTIFDDLEHNGAEIRTSADSRTVLFGQASGTGDYTGTGTVYFEGDLRPGNSPGQVSFGGNVVLGTTSTTQIELGGLTAGAQHDQLEISGTVNLDGTLDLLSLAPYGDPAMRGTADDFTIISAGSRSGTFSTVQYDGSTLATDFGPDTNGSFRNHAGSGMFRNIRYTATTVQLQNLLALAGDVDGDKDVDITDFNSLATHFDPDEATAPHSWLEGNFDGDQDVDITDFNFLASNFAPEGYGASAVPEPSTMLLVLLGLMLLAVARVP